MKVLDNFFLQNVLFLFFMDTIFRKEIYSPLQIYILCISINSESHTSILARAMLKELSLSLWRPPFSKALISVCYLWENRNAKMEELKIQENENSFFFNIGTINTTSDD